MPQRGPLPSGAQRLTTGDSANLLRPYKIELAQRLLGQDLLDQGEEPPLLEPDVRHEQLGKLPHRRRVRFACSQATPEASDESVDALVLEQRLHQQLAAVPVHADESREEPFLFLAKVPDGLRGEEAEEAGGRRATLGVLAVCTAGQPSRLDECVMVIV